MKCDISLQYYFAMIERCNFLVIDNADTFDGSGRNGLIKLATTQPLESKRRTLIGIMMNKTDRVPTGLETVGGRAYWIEGYETKEVK